MTPANATPLTLRARLLSVEGLVKRFGGMVALDGLTLELEAGRLLRARHPARVRVGEATPGACLGSECCIRRLRGFGSGDGRCVAHFFWHVPG